MVCETQEMDITFLRVRKAKKERQDYTLRNSSFQTHQRELATEVGRGQGSVVLKKSKRGKISRRNNG